MADDSNNKLYKSKDDKVLTGLSGGIAETYDLDPSMVRLLVLLVVIFTFPIGLIAYIAGSLIIPSEDEK